MDDEKWRVTKNELLELAYGYRMDWSGFDGRQLLQEVEAIIARAEKNE